MSSLARYWIFFVIVAVGLVLSWGQVGVKTRQTLESLPPMSLLSTESPCQPAQAPCAATSADRAVVLGPARNGLAVRQTGIDRGAIERAEAALLDDAGQVTERRLLLDRGDGWDVGRLPADVPRLQIQFHEQGGVTVAEFPL